MIGRSVAQAVLALMGVLALVVGGCAVIPAAPPEEQVRQRAQQRWDALVAGNVEAAYEFLSPGTRQARSLASYRALIRAGFWKQAKIERVECASVETCKVVVVVDYLFRGTLVSSPITEEWVWRDRQWWAVAG